MRRYLFGPRPSAFMIVICGLFFAASAKATLVGDQVDCAISNPNMTTMCSPSAAIVTDPGSEFLLTGALGDAVVDVGAGGFSVSVGIPTIINQRVTLSDIDWNGQPSRIVSASLTNNGVNDYFGLLPQIESFEDSAITIALAGNWVTGASIDIALEFEQLAIPLPTLLPVFGLGIIAVSRFVGAWP